MDKDRFRQSLGGLIEAYEAVAHRPAREIRLIPLLTGGQPPPVSSFPHSDSVYQVIPRLTAYDHLYNKERMR